LVSEKNKPWFQIESKGLFFKNAILFFKKTNLILGEKKAWFRVKVILFFSKSNTTF